MRDLWSICPMHPHEMADRQAILDKLAMALVVQRQRGLSGHWSYDLGLHRNMLSAYYSIMDGAEIVE